MIFRSHWNRRGGSITSSNAAESETAKVESLVEHDTDQSELMNTVAGVGGPSVGVNRSGFGATMSYWMIATASGG